MGDPDPRSSRVTTVTSPAAAQALLRPEQRRLLEPFVGRARTVVQAARELGLPPEQVAYRLRTLSHQGLLERVGDVPRGRPMAVYRAPDELRAPLDLLPHDDVHAFLGLVDAGLRDVFLASLGRLAGRSGLRDWVMRLHRVDDGTVQLDLGPASGTWDPAALLADDTPAVAFNWVPLALDDAAAKELQRELLALVGRYAGAAASAPTHLLGVFLTPLGE